ncbi:hypothetical protein VTH06DRAFT_5301, partial [Thermothelomyces fergusii]
MSDRRGRRIYRDDRDYYDGPHYYEDYEPRPRPARKRSLSRKVLDRLERAMGGLGLEDAGDARNRRGSDDYDSDSDDHSPSPPRRRHHPRDDCYYPPSSS